MIGCIVTILCLQQYGPFVRANRLISNVLPEQGSQDLGFYEDTYLNFTELATKYRYTSEEHTVVTEDGYILTVFRIRSKCEIKGYPVILAHGICDSSDAWILTGPETGLGYILSDNCYDVWAVNFRGNIYSRKHIRLNPDKDPEFWEFSFDENGNFDLPAVIDYVLNVTQRIHVYYVGHSQGSTNFFVMGSLRPEYNKKIRLSVQIAPVSWMRNMNSPIPKIISRETKSIKKIFDLIGLRELFGKQQLIYTFSVFLCQIFPDEICGTFLYLTTGYLQGSITSKILAVAIGHFLVGTSAKTLSHFGQLIMSGNFQRYDEDGEGNSKKYGTSTPPQYNVTRITSPIILVCAENDWISSLRDTKILSSKLPNLVDYYIVPERTWSHNNHLWDNKTTEYVFYKILNYFENFNT